MVGENLSTAKDWTASPGAYVKSLFSSFTIFIKEFGVGCWYAEWVVTYSFNPLTAIGVL